VIEEQGNCKTKQLAEELGIPTEKLKEILRDLGKNNLVRRRF
jgi:DNA-binding IscR family transcriptional regulator